MDRRPRLGLAVLVAVVGVLVGLGLAVWPFQYGLLESTVLAGTVVVFGLAEVVLDDSRFGA